MFPWVSGEFLGCSVAAPAHSTVVVLRAPQCCGAVSTTTVLCGGATAEHPQKPSESLENSWKSLEAPGHQGDILSIIDYYGMRNHEIFVDLGPRFSEQLQRIG